MPRSMTGFGRAIMDAPYGRLIIEIQSINRKHFEVSLNLPNEFFRFENTIRKGLKGKVFRGHLHLRLQVIPSIKDLCFPDTEQLKAVKEGWEEIALNLGLEKAQVTLPFVSQMAPQIKKNDIFEDEDSLQKCIDEAVVQLLQMKEHEGMVLVEDISQKIMNLKKLVLSIEKLTPNSVKRYREKIHEKMMNKRIFENWDTSKSSLSYNNIIKCSLCFPFIISSN